MKSYSNDLRERVIDDIGGGTSIQKAAVKWRISPRTISLWLKRYRDTGSYEPTKGNRGVRPKLLEYYDLVRKIVSERPDITASEIQSLLPVSVCLDTIYKTLKRLGFTYKKKPSCRRAKSSGCSRKT